MNDVAILHHCSGVTVMVVAFFNSNSQFFSMKGVHMYFRYMVDSENAGFLMPARSAASSLGAMTSRVVLNVWLVMNAGLV